MGLFAILLAFLVGRCTAPQSTQDKGGVLTSDVRVKTDTVYVPQKPIYKDTVIYRPVPKVVYLPAKQIPLKQADSTLTLANRVYQDSVKLQKNLVVGYKADVTGVLNNIQLGIKDTRPLMVVHDSVFTTNTLTKTKATTGLYLGFQTTLGNSQAISNFGPTLDLVRPKFSLGVGYDLKQASPQLRVSLNLLRDKATK